MRENEPSLTDEVFHFSRTILWKSILAQREQNVELSMLASPLDDSADEGSCCAPVGTSSRYSGFLFRELTNKGLFGSREYMNTSIFRSQLRCHDIRCATEYLVLLFGLT